MRHYSYNSGYDGMGGIAMPRMTRVVKAILIATTGAFVVQAVFSRALGVQIVGLGSGGIPVVMDRFSMIFGLSRNVFERGFIWQFVTYMFLHGGAWHLFLNMLMLFFLGPETERAIGSKRFLILYFASGMLGGVCWLACSGWVSGVPCVGASGAVFGVLGAFAALFPDRQITLLLFFVFPITLTARALALGLGALALFSMIGSQGGGVAHAAHLAGGLAGYFYIRRLMREGYHRFMYSDYSSGSKDGFGEWWRDLKASFMRRRIKVRRPKQTRSRGPSQSRVDAVLDKLADGGWGSLSREDREVLDEASKR